MLVFGLVLLAAGASAAMWRAPWTFPLTHPLWWSSTGVVLASWLLVGIATWAASRARAVVLAAAVLSPAGVFIALGVTGRFLFTATSPRFWGGVMLLGVIWSLAFLRTIRSFAGAKRALVLAGALGGAPWGVVWVLAQVPAPAATHPLLRELPSPSQPEPIDGVTVAGGVVRLPCGRARLELHPLLSFRDSSLDGFWPGVTRSPYEGAPPLEGPGRRADLRIARDANSVTIDASTQLPVPMHSHLNTFTDVRIEGLAAASVRFGATGAAVFELTPFDYPSGRPARFAYVSRDGELAVAQAQDAEKGPFTTLAQGAIGADAPLSLTVLDGVTPVCELSFLDFTAQADRTLSPTAGEGVSTNVVQFGIPANPPGPPVIHLSLAETGIGAGRAAITHAPGVYRNRVVITPRPQPNAHP